MSTTKLDKADNSILVVEAWPGAFILNAQVNDLNTSHLQSFQCKGMQSEHAQVGQWSMPAVLWALLEASQHVGLEDVLLPISAHSSDTHPLVLVCLVDTHINVPVPLMDLHEYMLAQGSQLTGLRASADDEQASVPSGRCLMRMDPKLSELGTFFMQLFICNSIMHCYSILRSSATFPLC